MPHPKKSLGQNFLTDRNIVKKIIKLINDYENKTIIEVGPGHGALTSQILKNNPKKLILIEKDKFLSNELSGIYKYNKSINIHNEDALNFDYNKINKPKSIIANLPYNISIKLVINWLKNINEFSEVVVMLQKEVAHKMNYSSNMKMNRLNFITLMTSIYNIEFNVSRNVFYPKPKVDSTIVKILPNKKINFNFAKLENFSRILFRHKRKKIINVLPKDKIKLLRYKKINPDILDKRAEDLTIDKIIYLFKKLELT